MLGRDKTLIHLFFKLRKSEYRKQSTTNMTEITLLYGPSNNSDNYVLDKQMLAK